MANQPSVVVLVSGSGTNLQAIIDNNIPISLVISDNPDAYAITRAKQANIATEVVNFKHYDSRSTWENHLIQAIAHANPELVVLAGFMKILSAKTVNQFRIINIHPSLLPAFPGANAHKQAIDAGVKITGLTIHEVDEKVDHGPILAQYAIPVKEGDTPQTLHARIQEQEHQLYPATIKQLLGL